MHVACMYEHLMVGTVCTLITYSLQTLSQDQLTLQHMQYAFITYPNNGFKIVVRMSKERVVVTVAELRLKNKNTKSKSK